MNTVVLIVIIAAVVLLVVLAIALRTSRRREATQLHERFGSEWERTVGRAESRKERRNAEHDLAERADTRDELEIQPLGAASRQQYEAQWHDTQARFVDTPQDALREAESLLDQVMRERGYPVDGFDEQAALDLGRPPRPRRELPSRARAPAPEPQRWNHHRGPPGRDAPLPVALRRAARAGLTRRGLPSYGAGIDVVTPPEHDGVAEPTVAGPLGEADLHDEVGSDEARHHAGGHRPRTGRRRSLHSKKATTPTPPGAS